MIRQTPIRTLVSSAVLAVLAHTSAFAGGFSLYTEGTGSAVGNFAAGVAAEAADASTGWYNPAGLALIHEQQVVFGGVGVFPTAKLNGNSTFRTTLPGVGTLPLYNQSFSGLDGGKDALVPSFHYARPLSDNLTVGLSVLAPFGLSTDWKESSPVRYEATLSELKTYNISPEMGAKINQHFALGAGLDLQYAKVKFNRMLGSPALSSFLNSGAATLLDSSSHNIGDSFGVGFHAGLMGMFNDNHTRVGINYQSQMRHQFNGDSTLMGSLAATNNIFILPYASSTSVSNSLYSNTIKLPEIVTLSGYQDVNDKLALLGSVVYSGWSALQTIQLNNVAAGTASLPTGAFSQVLVPSTSDVHYHDAWRFALGANYRVTDAWMMRVGGGYDQSPTDDAHRDVRLPEGNRWAMSIGTHYQFRPDVGVDLGYTYLTPDGTPVINKTDAIGATSSYNVHSSIKAHASLVGAQLVWKFDNTMPVATTK